MKKNKHTGRPAIACVLTLAILASFPLFAQQDGPVYIRAKKIYTCDESVVLAGAGILVEDGKIISVDKKAKPPKNVRVVDFSENIIIPGLIDAFSHMGFHIEDYNVREEPPGPPRAPLTGIYRIYFGQQTAVPRPPRIEARYKASDAVFFGDPSFRECMAEGITLAVIAIPTAGLSGGMPFVARLGGGSPPAFKMVDPLGMVFVFSGHGNVMKRYGDLKKVFQDALDYRESWEKYEKDLKKYRDRVKDKNGAKKAGTDADRPSAAGPQEPKEPRKNENHEAVLQAMDRKIPVLIRASRENEIQAALRIRDEFKVWLVIVGGQDAYKIPQELASRNVPVIAGPDIVLDKKGKRIGYIKELLENGIPVAFCSLSAQGAPFIPYQMAYAIQHGLSRTQALDLVTSHAAEIFNLSGRVGSIAAGKDADFVVLDGEPFDLGTKVKWIYVCGNRFFAEE